MLHESAMKLFQEKAIAENKKVEEIIEIYAYSIATEKLVATNVYHNIERPLSQALQPDTTLKTRIELINSAREHVRKFLRQHGFKGPF